MWMKALCRWLKWQKQTVEEHQVDELRAWKERREVELRKAQVTPWYYPPLC